MSSFKRENDYKNFLEKSNTFRQQPAFGTHFVAKKRW